MNLFPTILSILAPALAAAQSPLPQPSRPEAISGLGGELESVLVDEPGDGNVWARGRTYKARFGADGVEYISFLGSAAPRNFPLTFRVEEVAFGSVEIADGAPASPVLEGERVTYDRGAFLETWDLRLEEVEQRFVLPTRVAPGDLRVRLAVESDLSFAGHDGSGLLFEAPGLGAVRYGDATILDARGVSIARPAALVEGGIEIEVPATYLDEAAFPLVVDPIVTTITITNSGTDTFDADIAFDASTDRWLVVYEAVFSSTDRDLWSRRYTGAGALVETLAVDTTTSDTRDPAVANHAGADQFLIVWEEQQAVTGLDIRGRTRDAGSTSMGAPFTIRATLDAETDPDVGGRSAGGEYLVAWEASALGDPDVRARLVTTGGILGSVFDLASTGADELDPAVSKSAGPSGFWVVAYVRGLAISFSAVGTAGNVVQGTTDLTGAPGTVFQPDVDGDGDEFLTVWGRAGSFGNNDVEGAVVRRQGLAFNVDWAGNLSVLEPGVPFATEYQHQPAVAKEGCRYTYVYVEGTFGLPFSDFDTYAAVVSFPGSGFPVFHDGHVPLGTAPEWEERPAIASKASAGGAPLRSFIAWNREATLTNHDLHGALWDGMAPTGGTTLVQTGCGTPEPSLLWSGTPALGLPFNVFVSMSAGPPLLVVGLPGVISLCPSQGGCVLGVGLIVAIVQGNSLQTTIPCDPSLVGATVAVQGFNLGGTGGCAPPAWGIPFVASDTLRVTIQ